MLVAFFESIKYVGHLLPVAALRIYLGVIFFQSASVKYDGDYLLQPKLAAAITENLPNSNPADWYRAVLENWVLPNWPIFAYTITFLEFLIGVSLIIGFFVRPVGLLGVLLLWNYLYISPASSQALMQLQLTLMLVLVWVGAGRCLGFDYFFYKRQRGLLW